MRHLRNHSNYLLPGGSHFFSMFKSAGALTLNFLAPFLWFTGLILWATVAYMGLLSHAFHSAVVTFPMDLHTYEKVLSEIRNLIGAYWNNVGWHQIILSFLVLGLTLYACLPVRESKGKEIQFIPRRLRVIFPINILILSFSLFVASLGNEYISPVFLFDPVFIVTFDILLVFFFYALISLNNPFCSNRTRSFIYLVSGSLVFLLCYSLLFAILPFLIKSVSGVVIPFLQVVVGVGIKYLLGMEERGGVKQTSITRHLSSLKELVLNIAVFFFVLLFLLVVARIADRFIWEGLWLQGCVPYDANLSHFLVLILTGLALFFLLPLFNFNRLSNHYFYRDRLSEAFLMTSVMAKKGAALLGDEYAQAACIVRNLINMGMTRLHGIDGCADADESEAESVAAMGPYHIINATLNLTGSHDLQGLRRKTEPFIFSRLFTGSERTGYIKTGAGYPGLTLARAITTSGAAVAPIMGMMTSRLRSFACTILGIRLGLWLRNPLYLAKGVCKDDKIRYWLLPLLRELTGTAGSSEEIYISDGGHSGDNLGIVPLLKRRMKLVIASDAECDKDYLFNSLNSSLRNIFVDEGIKADMTLGHDLFQKNDQGLVKSHYMIGRILYPDRPWQASWLVVLKSSVTGDELTPILNYKKKSPDFPQETTANQFFTEEQFEAYRALGRHISYTVFEVIRKLEGFKKKGDSWAEIDSLCRALVHKLQVISAGSSYYNNGVHPWDDIFQAMWDSEEVDFGCWETFSKNVKDMAKDAEKAGRKDALIENLLLLSKWLYKNGKFMELISQYEVPRTIEEFTTLQRELSIREPSLFTIRMTTPSRS